MVSLHGSSGNLHGFNVSLNVSLDGSPLLFFGELTQQRQVTFR
jgi:hypothetical protein